MKMLPAKPRLIRVRAGSSRFWKRSLLTGCVLCVSASAPLGCFAQEVRQPSVRASTTASSWSPQKLATPIARDPIFVYNNWSSYDELSDNVPLTEQLAMREFDEMLRLRKLGVRFDYYMMDAFWFASDGGYRKWKTPNWPNGPDLWIKRCQEAGIKPGLWFSTNTLVKIAAAPEWRDSLNKKEDAMSFYEGGFLPDFMGTLQYWYDRGIRMFKFDFVDFNAATPHAEASQTREEIRLRNVTALREALVRFRTKNPDVVLEAFNGFGGDLESTASPFPFRDPVDLRWLQVFDAEYAGDPRPSDVPEASFWRSMDVYSDHMVRRFEQSGLPLERIDSTGFMVGKTGTIYCRGLHAWRGALILMMARGGWVDTIHGNLELINGQDARWFAKVQSLFLSIKSLGRTKTFGGVPGEGQAYGFGSVDPDGAVYTVVNPAQRVERVEMPRLSQEQKQPGGGRLLFRDDGFMPRLDHDHVELGPGQMAVVGYGKYALPQYEMGVQMDVVIPREIAPIPAEFRQVEKGVIETTADVSTGWTLRLVMRQHSPDGTIRRTWAGGPPTGTSMGKVFRMEVTQAGRSLPISVDYDRVIWSGLSWAAGEIKESEIKPGVPVTVRFSSSEKDPVTLEGELYRVKY